MVGVFLVTVTLEDVEPFKLAFKSKKTAIDIRDQLIKAGYEAKAEMAKELD